MTMSRFLVARLVQLLPALVVTSIGVWGLAYLLPGSPAVVLLGPNAPQSQIAAETRLLGLDKPLPVQYAIWITHVVQGQFGLSDVSRVAVTTLLGPAAEASLQLAVLAFIIAIAIGVPLGVASGSSRSRRLGSAVSWYNSLTLGVPTFWLGILLILAFGIGLHVFPTSSDFVAFWDQPLESLRNLFLPALTLGLYMSGIIARFLRTAMVGAMQSDYVHLALAKGASQRRIAWLHALRNAMLPTLTVVGLQLGAFIGGAVITEAVFNYPGMGTLVLNALLQRDYPTLQASILLIVTTFIVVNMLVDALYAVLDPRIRYGR